MEKGRRICNGCTGEIPTSERVYEIKVSDRKNTGYYETHRTHESLYCLSAGINRLIRENRLEKNVSLLEIFLLSTQ